MAWRDPAEPTAVQRRDAWLALVKHLERELLATRENGRAGASLHASEVGEAVLVPEYRATAWAAQRLLDSITALTAPEVPRDDETGQGSILDVLQEMQDPNFLAKRKAPNLLAALQESVNRAFANRDAAQATAEPGCGAVGPGGCVAKDCPLATAPVCWRTLPVAEPYDIRKVHWVGEGGGTLHPIAGLTQPLITSGDEDDVTCARCLAALSQQ